MALEVVVGVSMDEVAERVGTMEDCVDDAGCTDNGVRVRACVCVKGRYNQC